MNATVAQEIRDLHIAVPDSRNRDIAAVGRTPMQSNLSTPAMWLYDSLADLHIGHLERPVTEEHRRIRENVALAEFNSTERPAPDALGQRTLCAVLDDTADECYKEMLRREWSGPCSGERLRQIAEFVDTARKLNALL